MDFSRTDDKSLGATAHEILREISSKTPEVLKAHVQEICRTLQDKAPSAKKPNDAGAVDDLKACASFASKYPKEIPQDRKFVQAMTSFALHGSPPEAAKYAVSVMWAATDKKEALIRDLTQKCIKGFKFGEEGFLSCLATLSQLMLLTPKEIDDQSTDDILEIAIKQVLHQVRKPSSKSADTYEWSATIDPEASAKCWALKILVNRVRSHPVVETLPDVAAPVYQLLSTLISKQGELSADNNTPPTHKSRLRLLAARLYLKLCTQKSHDALLTPSAFNALATVAQDSESPIRGRFLQRLRKYLNQQKLPQRFYTIPFLLAFEPSNALKSDVTTWIKSRAAAFVNAKASGSSSKANIVMESVFARLISVLSHHPDYGNEPEDLIEFSHYIIFYLQNVATAENLSLIYHIAQRVKQCRDAISSAPAPDYPTTEADDRLYHLSDLAQVTIRKYEDMHNWTIQTLPGKVRLPSSLFSEIKSHSEAQRIAEHHYLPEGVEAGVEDLLKVMMRAAKTAQHGKKRKSEGGDTDGRHPKKAKSALAIRKASGSADKQAVLSRKTKTPKAKKIKETEELGSGERRRSGRVKEVEKSYVERDSEEDDEEMEMMESGALEEAESEADVEASEPDEEDEEDIAEEEVREEVEEEVERQEEEEGPDNDDEEPAAPKTTPKSTPGGSKKKLSVSPQAKSKAPPRTKQRGTTRSRAVAV